MEVPATKVFSSKSVIKDLPAQGGDCWGKRLKTARLPTGLLHISAPDLSPRSLPVPREHSLKHTEPGPQTTGVPGGVSGGIEVGAVGGRQ